MIDALFNQMRATADLQGQSRAATRQGVITGYDPDTHAVKVTLQPDDVLTGWIPLKAAAVGPGWGVIFAPALGEVVELAFQEGDGGVGSAGLRFFTDDERPPSCPAGEWLMLHKAGASIRWTGDGKLTLTDAAGAVVQLSNDGNVRITATEVIVSQKLTVGGDVMVSGDVTAGPVSLKGHLHVGVAAGGALSGKPQQ